MVSSECSVELDVGQPGVIRTHWLVHIVGVQSVLGQFFFLGGVLPFEDDLLSHHIVLLKHLHLENFTDFEVVSRYSVVEDVGWESHSVLLVPVSWAILFVEESESLCLSDVEPGEHAHVDGHATDALEDGQVSVSVSYKSAHIRSIHAQKLIHFHELEVSESKHLGENVEAVLSWSDLKGPKETSKSTRLFSQIVVNDSLQERGVSKQESLNSIRHYYYLIIYYKK